MIIIIFTINLIKMPEYHAANIALAMEQHISPVREMAML
jgi:hypothetical protein